MLVVVEFKEVARLTCTMDGFQNTRVTGSKEATRLIVEVLGFSCCSARFWETTTLRHARNWWMGQLLQGREEG